MLWNRWICISIDNDLMPVWTKSLLNPVLVLHEWDTMEFNGNCQNSGIFTRWNTIKDWSYCLEHCFHLLMRNDLSLHSSKTYCYFFKSLFSQHRISIMKPNTWLAFHHFVPLQVISNSLLLVPIVINAGMLIMCSKDAQIQYIECAHDLFYTLLWVWCYSLISL